MIDNVTNIVRQWRSERPDLDPGPLLVFGRISQLALSIDTRLRPPFAEAGLGNGDFDVLTALRRSGSPFALTPRQLAATMLVTSGAVTKRVDRLKARGLVAREVTADDARGRLITLTRSGRRLVDRLIAVHLANERALLAGFTPREVTTLADLLGRLAAHVEDTTRIVGDR